MSMNPNKLALHREVDFIPVNQFSGLVPTLRVGAGTIGTNMEIGLDVNTAAAKVEGGTGVTAERILTTTPEDAIRMISMGNGFPYLTRIGSVVRTSGLLVALAGDDVNHLIRIPNYWDRRNDILVRAVWTTNSTTVADTITWKFLYDQEAAGVLLGAASGALDTVLVADNVLGATAPLIHVTPDGKIKGGTLADTSRWINFLVEMDSFTAGLTEDKWLLGVEFEYTPRLGRSIKSAGRAFQVGQ